MADFENFKTDFALLFEAGMLSIKQGDEDSAKKIFESLEVLNPEHHGKDLGIALIALHKMDLLDAKSKLEVLSDRENDDWSIKAFLSLTNMLIVLQQGSSFEIRRDSLEKSYTLAEAVLSNCEVATTRHLAQSIMDWHGALVAKSTGPLG